MLSNKQFGFRPNRSTLDALFQLTNQINLNMDKRYVTLAVFIDFSKACVQHELLLQKLETLNFDKDTFKLLESYHSQRKQKVLANGIFPNYLNVSQGVPQGSIIVPLLYIIYANDVTKIIKNSQFALYADDLVLFSKCSNLAKAKIGIQKDLKALEKWCAENRIFVNVNKTKCMTFGSKLTLSKNKEVNTNLTISGQPISKVHSYCYLGMLLDEQLNYEQQAQLIVKRVRNKLVQLCSMRYFLTNKAALLIYKNMILPILEYGNIFLSSLSSSTLKKMQIIQNKALRLAIDYRRELSLKDLHTEAKLQKLKVRRQSHTLQFMFHQKSNKKLLVRRATGRITRSSNKLLFKLPRPRTEKFKSSLPYFGFKLWNQVPAGLQKVTDLHCFKH